MSKTLAALFLGMGIGYMNLINCLGDEWWLFLIPFVIGLFFFFVDLMWGKNE